MNTSICEKILFKKKIYLNEIADIKRKKLSKIKRVSKIKKKNVKNKNWRSSILYTIYILITYSGREFCSDYKKST